MPFHRLNPCSNVLIARGAASSFMVLVQEKKGKKNICIEENVSLPPGSFVLKSSYITKE